MRDWLTTASTPDIRNRAARVALVVGTLLAVINHGDALVAGEIDFRAIVQISLTYLVPYGVSTYAGVEAVRKTSRGN